MRKLALLAAMCAAAIAATGAQGAGPEHITTPVNDTFEGPFLENVCGVPVVISIQGVAHVTLWRNEEGLVERERDSFSSFTAVFSSPTELGGTGRSFTNHTPAVTSFEYGSGAAVGSTAVITLTGLGGQAAGSGTEVSAGYQRLTGTVIAFSPEGIPIVDFDGPLTAEHGRWPAFDAILAERCAALGGSLQL